MTTVTTETKKRLSIPINQELHKKLKIISAEKGETISQYVINAIEEKMKKEEK